MENWRHYAKRIDEDKNFQLVLENIENAETQKDADLVIEAWIEEQEKILNEFEMMKKGMSADDVLKTFKTTPRTKNAGGGLNYLMGL